MGNRHRFMLAWNAIVYVLALTMFDVPVWKSLVVGVLVFVSTLISYGSRPLMMLGAALQIILLAVWVHVLPGAQDWPNALHEMLAWIRPPPA